MDPRLQAALERQQMRQQDGISVADLSDEEISLRGDHAKEAMELQLRQSRARAQLRARVAAAQGGNAPTK